MKLESTLRSRRTFLHLASLLDIIFLLLLFFLLSSDAVVRSGIAVTTPKSWSSLNSATGADVITVSGSASDQIFFNDKLTTIEKLKKKLIKKSGEDGVALQVIIRADQTSPFGVVIEICNLVADAGFSPILATRADQRE
ncbi:MAG: biopolymer transporter ExbD [Verrucomicrobiales bacterium]